MDCNWRTACNAQAPSHARQNGVPGRGRQRHAGADHTPGVAVEPLDARERAGYGARMTFAAKENITICFAHVAYRMAERFALRGTGLRHFQVYSPEELNARIAEADVLSVSM